MLKTLVLLEIKRKTCKHQAVTPSTSQQVVRTTCDIPSKCVPIVLHSSQPHRRPLYLGFGHNIPAHLLSSTLATSLQGFSRESHAHVGHVDSHLNGFLKSAILLLTNLLFLSCAYLKWQTTIFRLYEQIQAIHLSIFRPNFPSIVRIIAAFSSSCI